MRGRLGNRSDQWTIPGDTWCQLLDLGSFRAGYAPSCDSTHVVSIGTGRPVAPFAFPSFHATPAMSRCAQSNFFANRDRKHAAVMLPPARPPTLAKSAKLLLSPSW